MTHIDTSRERFGIAFSMLARRWRRAIDSNLADAGLTDATWAPLLHLKESGGGVTQKTLAQRVGVDGSSLVRVLDILEREALIERRRDARDGRARLIDLTLDGERRVASIRKTLGEVEASLLTGLDDREVGALLTGFAAIDQRMSELEQEAAAQGEDA